MLWRTDYSPIILREFQLPVLTCELLSVQGGKFDLGNFSGPALFAFGPESYHGLTVWRKLFDSENWESYPILLVLPKWEKRDLETARASFAPSQLRFVGSISDPIDEFYRVLKSVSEGEFENRRAGAILIKNGVVLHGVYGPPTEEAWEEFTVKTQNSG